MADALKPLRIDSAALPLQTWEDPAKGTLHWQSLFSGGQTASDSLTCGVALIEAGEHFALHRHAQAEVYFGLEGRGTVMIDGVPHDLSPGVALFIPGDAEHGIPLATERLRWFYSFAADRFEDVAYRFS